MLTNFHTHTNFCDGANTPEEMVISAIEKGFDAIGFSGHGYTSFDLKYCMKDTKGYISEINRLKEKYKNKIQIYLGIEEDSAEEIDRSCFDYIIGSSHYFKIENKFYPVDSDLESFLECLDLFNGDILKLAHCYYEPFAEYIVRRKPDIVGHFDLITKFDDMMEANFKNICGYEKIAEQYLIYSLKSESIFEVNTGAVSRGYRKTPYPYENLLYVLKKENGKVMINSDSHSADLIDCNFKESRKMLKDIGFEYVYILYNNQFRKDYL